MPNASGLNAVAEGHAGVPRRGRVLTACCGAHILHDGYSDLLYVLLPVWQAQFGLSFAEIGLLKTTYSGSMAALQMPASLLAERLGERLVLALGTAIAAGAYLLIGTSGTFLALVACLVLGGLGSSVQHPLSSSLTARAFDGPGLRAALGTYNFSGDLGKMLFPAAIAWIVAVSNWRAATTAVGVVGIATAAALLCLVPMSRSRSSREDDALPDREIAAHLPPKTVRRGFVALSLIGVIDSATRMGFLTLLPFLLTGKDASLTTVGAALTLVFAGGAAGKFICGLVAARVGVLRTVILTEVATLSAILAALVLPLVGILALMLPLGVALNGTSSVLYGSVAELTTPERRARAFGLFYTCTIGAGALSPTVFGGVSDALGIPIAMVMLALSLAFILPLTLPLRTALRSLATPGSG
ncbi:MAG TPA: MFS transporter [Stellaceae bacterium]|nr:MFS transporter [Stellaceae bacterium]